jgi:TPR repeat protein
VAKNEKAAMKWFRKAAESGDEQAKVIVGYTPDSEKVQKK